MSQEGVDMDEAGAIDLAAIRRRLAEERGRQFWRSLEELADTPALHALLEEESPRHAATLLETVDRRQFLKLMSASLALAGLGACTRQPTEKIVPYVKPPEEIVPGLPLFFATAMPFGGYATGLVVESHMGRPTKIEGNPDHPASLGATDAFAQASILGLYDPERSQVITSAGEIRPWSALVEALRAALEQQDAKKGAGLRLLTETVTSPTLAQQIRDLLAAYPEARWHQWEPTARDSALNGARLALDASVDVQYRFDRADVILALDADFLARGPGHLAYVRAFSAKRRVGEGRKEMNRLYVAESTPAITGAKADHRLVLKAGEIEDLAWAVAAAVTKRVKAPEGLAAHARWIEAVVRDLGQHRGASIVIAGDEQPPVVHALAHAVNQALGNVGKTVLYTDPVAAEPVDQAASLRELVAAMDAGKVEVLLILGANPAHAAPPDLRFGERLAKVPLRIHHGLYEDETALLCQWHVPEAHYLESWSDARAYDGSVSIIQPLIAPLYEGCKTAHEVLAACLGRSSKPSYDVVRDYWKAKQPGGGDFEAFWRRALHDGIVAGTALPPREAALTDGWAERAARARSARKGDGLEIVFRPDPTIHDGRFANNGWLQELPKPVTKLTWDNVAQLSPATAERLGLENGDVVELRSAERVVRAPAWVVPGQADDSVTVHLGYGRKRAGQVGNEIGFDANLLRTAAVPWIGQGLEIRKTGERFRLACTQDHFSMEGRNLIRTGTLEEFRTHPEFVHEMGHDPHDSLYAPWPYEGYAWGMAIDLNACTGCNACVIACQAENNIAVVGKDQVARGREMQWIRLDRYFAGDPAAPTLHYQPVACVHCEKAPCEVVCPVNATVHSGEGLNSMVYNRCVGTKYCSNNCPYKVRRFNFFLYSDWATETFKLQRNPDVTVRARGVMEKCSYCLQRINAGRIKTEKEGRRIQDGEVVTACQQACPAEAIVFGDINDPKSRVAQLRADPRSYGLLAELNVRPRTRYLAELKNPNPEVEKA